MTIIGILLVFSLSILASFYMGIKYSRNELPLSSSEMVPFDLDEEESKAVEEHLEEEEEND